MSVSELAAASRLSEARLERLEDGALDPGFALLVRIARSLGVAPGVVFDRAEQIAASEDDA